MKKILKTLFIFILSMTVYNAVNAASVTISPTEKTIAPGEKVNISAGVVEAAGWDLEITTSGGTLSGNLADADSSGTETTKTVLTPTFTANAEGTYTITVKGEVTYEDASSDIGIAKKTVSATSKITVKAADDNNNQSSSGNNSSSNNSSTGDNNSSSNSNSSSNNSGSTTVTKSSNNKLSNLGIRPNDFSGFKANTTKYSVTVPNSVSEVEVYATAQDSKATVSGTGKMQLDVGSNQAKVVCTAEDGTTKTYVINISRKSLEEQAEQQPEEQEPEEVETTEQTDETTEVTQITIGLSKLEAIGKNEKGEDVEVELTPTFDENQQEYLLTVPLSVVDVEINAEATDGEAQIEVMGNKNLVEGENVITVIVKVGDNTKVYEIKVNKVAVEGSFLSQELIIQLAVIAAIITIVIVAIIVIIVMIAKNSKKDKTSKKSKSSTEISNEILPDDDKTE